MSPSSRNLHHAIEEPEAIESSNHGIFGYSRYELQQMGEERARKIIKKGVQSDRSATENDERIITQVMRDVFQSPSTMTPPVFPGIRDRLRKLFGK